MGYLVGSGYVTAHDNQLDKVDSLGFIGVVTESSDSLFGAVVHTPNSNWSGGAGNQPPNSKLVIMVLLIVNY